MRRLLGIVFMLIATLAILGCGADSGSKDIFTEPGLAAKAIAELKERPELKGKDIQIFNHVVIMEYEDIKDRIDIQILVPGTDDKVNNYFYQKGKWSDPEPDKYSGNLVVKDHIIPIDTIDFSKVPEIYKVAEEKAKTIENGKVEKSLVYLFDSYEKQHKAYIGIKGSKEKCTAIFDSNGIFYN